MRRPQVLIDRVRRGGRAVKAAARRRPRVAVGVVAVVIVAVVAALALRSGGSGAAPSVASGGDLFAVPPALPTCATATPSAAAGATAAPAPVDDPNGVDPFAVAGARQVLAPDMTTTTIPAQPVTRSFTPPPNPDAHVAAYQDSGVADGPVPTVHSYASHAPSSTTVTPRHTTTTSSTSTTVPACIDQDQP